MDRLMNTAYPVEKVKDIWQVERVLTFDLACRYVYHPVDCRSTSCSNLYPVEAYPGGEKSFARLRKKVSFVENFRAELDLNIIPRRCR